ncbi:NTP transferase domain-containing protein [Niveispirillum sp. SYP-B3756]|uniref:NTP transferase domain-containing protein n=1 Tax=Niveispirillum sp. SYP-B3756 TaxID=2662178 RepID=UPI0012924C45|nr:molybdopterin-binding/glycosyltransferase family 2 protein [Niveispirillum sp. SYP-B3756]MQP65363.1 NTP transferase domain-containing protein [Niveispirillum sp. SYP-B3756]
MRFGSVPTLMAAGHILAHALSLPDLRLRKGHVLTVTDTDRIIASGIETIIVAQLDADDVAEDRAATRVGQPLAGPGLTRGAAFTGRVNLFAASDGLLVLDRAVIDRANRIDEGVTIATLPPFTPVVAGQMVATVKIIPFAVPESIISQVEQVLGEPSIWLSPWAGLSVGLVQTLLPGTKPGVLDKTRAVLAQRLAGIGASLAWEQRVAHEETALAAVLAANRADLLLIVGASAITDRRDVIPLALEQAGGTVRHLGMPVDPGNLLMLGERQGKPVLGLPGCARSPKLNGVDWLLWRFGAGLDVAPDDIMAMGVGGLLAEVAERPVPRAVGARQPRIHGLILAAGSSRRMGQKNKLLLPLQGKPLLRHVVDAAVASQLSGLTLVTGHDDAAVRAMLNGQPLHITHAADHAAGMSASLKVGLASLPADLDGVMVLLGDMPLVTAADIDRLIAAFSPADGRGICVPSHGGQRGNPILWNSTYLPEMQGLSGDRGARDLLLRHATAICDVPMDRDGVLRDADTPEALADLIALTGER